MGYRPMKKIPNKLVRSEEGYALLLALILLLVGSLIITPLLGFMSTGLIASQVHEKQTMELYAADAGVEDAIWKIITKATGIPQAEGEDPLKYAIGDVNSKTFTAEAIVVEYIDERTYRIESTATSPAIGSSTTVESYVSILDFTLFTNNVITSIGDIDVGNNSVVNGEVQYNGNLTIAPNGEVNDPTGVSDDEIVGWPEADSLSGFYWANLQDDYPSYTTYSDGTVIDAKDTDEIGPLYCEGDFVIQTTTPAQEITLQGTVCVAGDLEFRQTGKVYDIYLNGNTIFVEGAIDIPAGKCYLHGPGCIIAVGDIDFQPNIVGTSFIFVMSVEGETYISPGGDFSGSIAGKTKVNLQPGNILSWEPPSDGLNLPGEDDSENVIDRIHTWEIGL